MENKENVIEYWECYINKLMELSDGWDGECSYAMSIGSADHAFDILHDERAHVELINYIYPNQNGFLSISWENSKEDMIDVELGIRQMSYFVLINGKLEFHEHVEINQENLDKLFYSLSLLDYNYKPLSDNDIDEKFNNLIEDVTGKS